MLLNGEPTATELLADAVAQKYTINGEMFSVQYLYELTRKHLNSAGVCLFHEGLLDCARIKEQLIAGACLLVPYPFFKNKSFLALNPKCILGSTGAACSAAKYILTFGII